jgi:hypothetical protein
MARVRGDRPPDVAVAVDDADRVDRFERMFAQEIAESASLNTRGSTLGGFSVIALLLSALFAANWLDDGKWRLDSLADKALTAGFWLGSIAFALCVLVSVWATFPRGSWMDDQRSRIAQLAKGEDTAQTNTLVQMIQKQHSRNRSKVRWVRIAGMLMAIGVVAAAVQGLGFALGADLQDNRAQSSAFAPPGAPADTGLTPEQTDALVRRYAPIVWVHSRDRFVPLSPDRFLEGSSLTWRTRRGRNIKVVDRGRVDPRRLGRACGTARGGCYSYGGYVTGELTRPFQDGDRPDRLPENRGFALDLDDRLRVGTGTDTPLIYEVGTRKFDGEMRIGYWFVYGWSVPFRAASKTSSRNIVPFSHEGDWEGIDVVLGLADKRPRRVEYYQHEGSQAVDWRTVKREGAERTHPVVYSARNSHASYPTAAPTVTNETKTCRKTLGITVCSWDLRDQGRRWAPWEGGGGLVNARTQPWYGFGGAWGRAGGGGEATGPLGPSHWKRPND